ncbi:MAG: hypothetical protein LBJ60_06070 [Tannerellaceae bacterium]|jgi:hypothetical protein|nr:hypothetical protein [Tannerellaceae bacterium]
MEDNTRLSTRFFYEPTNPFGFPGLRITISPNDTAYMAGWLGATIYLIYMMNRKNASNPYYLLLLLFTQNAGTGSNTTYGLGQFRIVEP